MYKSLRREIKILYCIIIVFLSLSILHCDSIGDQVTGTDTASLNTNTYGDWEYVQVNMYDEDTGSYVTTDYPMETEYDCGDGDEALETLVWHIYLSIDENIVRFYYEMTFMDDDNSTLYYALTYCSAEDESSEGYTEGLFFDVENDIMTITTFDPNEYIKLIKTTIPDGAIESCE